MTGTGNLLQRAIPRLYLAASGTVTNDSVSDVLDSAQEVTKDTANEVNQFVQYFYDHIPNLISFAIEIVLALIFFFLGRIAIKWIRKLTRKMLERSNVDKGVETFVDSLLNKAAEELTKEIAKQALLKFIPFVGPIVGTGVACVTTNMLGKDTILVYQQTGKYD